MQYDLRRKRTRRHTSAVSIFSNRLVCGDCVALFGSKVWHSNDPNRCVIWRCNRKCESKGERCSTPHLREEEIQTAFVEAVNQLITQRDKIIAAFEMAIAQLYGTDDLVLEVDRLKVEEDVLCKQINDMIQLNATTAQDQTSTIAGMTPWSLNANRSRPSLQRQRIGSQKRTGSGANWKHTFGNCVRPIIW